MKSLMTLLTVLFAAFSAQANQVWDCKGQWVSDEIVNVKNVTATVETSSAKNTELSLSISFGTDLVLEGHATLANLYEFTISSADKHINISGVFKVSVDMETSKLGVLLKGQSPDASYTSIMTCDPK